MALSASMTPKTVLITGCTNGGAGAALALEFHRRGHTVFATSTDGSRMDTLVDVGITTLALNVTSQPSIKAAAETIREATGGCLDILINNAAVFEVMPLADVDLDRARKVFDINFFGALAVIQAFIPLLTKSEGESIVANVGTLSAVMCPPWQGVYASSKAALTAMSHILRLEFAPLGVKVISIISGGVDTAGLRSHQSDLLPKDSLYKTLAYSIETNEQGTKVKKTSPEDYAKQVVDDLTRQNPKPMIWRGAFSGLAWMMSWFGWVGMLDGGQIERSGLNQVKRPE